MALTLYIMHARSMPDLQPWHEYPFEDDFDKKNAGESLEAYLAREERIFGSLNAHDWGSALDDVTYSRFDAGNISDPNRYQRNWNRSFVFEAERPKGAALLLHGLSDSPYSLRAVGELLHARGFYVLGLRLPGHGTVPGALIRTHWRDWREAVRVGARHVAEKAGDGPFVIVGYSNGAPLAVDYTLGALDDGDVPLPAQLVLFSPALGVSRAAGFARFQRWLSRIPGLHKLGWTDILPEYDPYKYNSFPIEAGEQIYGLTSQLTPRLQAPEDPDALADFPPVLAFQSVVDATIPAASVMKRLLGLLPENRSELVLFDVNHRAAAQELIRPGPAALLSRILKSPPTDYAITVVTNEDPRSDTVIAKTRAAKTDQWSETPIGLTWPAGVYSLSHVALPFRVDDPFYGRGDGRLSLGSIEARGERHVLVVPAAQLMRLRYNPFFEYVSDRIRLTLDAK